MPSSVVRLRRLMYLRIGSGVELPSGIDNLTSLEVLDGPKVGKFSSCGFNHHIVKELGHLTKLRVLGFICGDLDESTCTTLVESLSNLHKLEILDIRVEFGRVDLMQESWVPSRQLRRLWISGYPFRTLPAWINPSALPLLSFLSIKVSKVQSEAIQLLGMLRALRYLFLWVDGNLSGEDVVVEMSVVTADAFPRATNCSFYGIAVVPSIFPRGAAPRLQALEFGFPATWMARGDLDLSMGHLPSLNFASVRLLCKEASDEEVDEADAALRAAAAGHPNRPLINIHKKYK